MFVLLLIFAIIVTIIKLDSKGLVFFIRERFAKNGKIFSVYKLRAMVQGADIITRNIPLNKKNLYITRMGKSLRRIGLDELPQFVNVLKGDISFVGPPSALPYQIEKYNNFQKKLLFKQRIAGCVINIKI